MINAFTNQLEFVFYAYFCRYNSNAANIENIMTAKAKHIKYQ